MVCPHCSSLYIVKEGKRKNSEGALYQRMSCKSCKKWYSLPIDTEVRGRIPEISPGKIFSEKYNEKVRIHGLTDVHVGANEFDMKKFKECVVAIMEDPNARWFGNGDLIELIPPGYKSISQRGQSIPPEEQYLTFIDLVQPIRDKCLFIRGGNHDFLRSQSILDMDVVKLIANELNVPYYPMPGYSRIDVQGTKWHLVSGHGKSGAKNGDLELDKMAAVYSDGDVFFLGHNHHLYTKPIDSLRIVNGEETLHRRWYIRGGSFLRYADYARYSFYPLVRTGWTTIEFSKNRIKCWTN